MPVVLRNNAVSRLAASLGSGATNLSVTAGDGVKFPSVAAGEWFPLTILKASGALEVCRATARSGDVITIARAQEGTVAQAFTAGDRVELRLTTAAFADIVEMVVQLRNDALLDANNLADLTDPAAARASLQLGNAATRNMTNGVVDTDTSKVVKPGDFGVGGNCIQVSDWNSAYNDFGGALIGGNANLPGGSGESINATGLNLRLGGLVGAQMMIYNGDNQFLFRSSFGGFLPWVKMFHTGNVSAYSQTLLALADAAAARTATGAMAASQELKQNVETLWSGNVGTVGVALTLSRPLVAGDLLWVDHADARNFPTHPQVLSANRMVTGSLLPFTFGNTWIELTFTNASQLTTRAFTDGYPIRAIYASKAKV